MTAPLVPGDLAARIEGRLAEAMRVVSDEHLDVAGGCAGFSGLGSWSNQAVGLGFAGELSADDIGRIIDFHSRRGAEPKVELAPHAHPSCIARLREAGFVINGFEQVLLRPTGPGSLPLPEPDPSVRVEVVDPTDPAARERFLAVQTHGFKDDIAAAPTEHDRRLFPRYMMHPSVRAVMAFIGEEPAGVGLVEFWPPLAQLFGGSTVPVARRRGVQTALILARLKLAAEAGCTLAGTDSAPGGGTERNAIRIGFTPLYTRVSLVRPGHGLV